MKKMRSHFLVVAVCAGALCMACSEDSDAVAGGAVEDSGLVAYKDTVYIHDSIKVKVKVRDTVVVKDTLKKEVVVKDTVNTKDTLVFKDTVVVKDTVKTKDTVVVHDTVSRKDTAYVITKGTIFGVSQKGPFTKGSSVTVFELDGTNALKQTGRSFNGTISADNGSFKIKNVSLVSSYVHLTATGTFRDEISGGKSTTPITLRALSKLDGSRASVNVNLLTHLEYDRVAYLLEKNSRMDLSEAKRQAEKEIFAMFLIDADKFGYSEDLNIFGSEDADAALLAISIMLSGNRSVSEIMELLTALSQDMAEDGSWDDNGTLDSIAKWTQDFDLNGSLPKVRENILSWKIGSSVPDFEKFVRKFWTVHSGLGECGKNVSLGSLRFLPKDSTQSDSVGYICVDSATVGNVWRVANAIDMDTLGYGRRASEGQLRRGRVNTDSMYVYENGAFRKANEREVYLNLGCTSSMDSAIIYQHSAYVCRDGLWEFDASRSEKGYVVDTRDSNRYATVGIGSQVWMAENVKNNFDTTMFCFLQETVNCLIYGASLDIGSALDGYYIAPHTDEYNNPPAGACGGKTSDRCVLKEEHQGVCPTGFHIPSRSEFSELIRFVDLFNGDEDVATSLKSKTGWTKEEDNGTDRFGFNALSAGWEYYNGQDRVEQTTGVESVFWVKPESTDAIFDRPMFFRIKGNSATFEQPIQKTGAELRYVRCLKNSAE